jgi:hypothetical protein
MSNIEQETDINKIFSQNSKAYNKALEICARNLNLENPRFDIVVETCKTLGLSKQNAKDVIISLKELVNDYKEDAVFTEKVNKNMENIINMNRKNSKHLQKYKSIAAQKFDQVKNDKLSNEEKRKLMKEIRTQEKGKINKEKEILDVDGKGRSAADRGGQYFEGKRPDYVLTMEEVLHKKQTYSDVDIKDDQELAELLKKVDEEFLEEENKK